VLAQIPDPNLRAYVVWLPVLPSGAWESAARRAGGRIPDARATRYFDRDAHLGHLYAPILHLPEGLPAWDVYLVFARQSAGKINRPRLPTGCTNSAAEPRLSFVSTATR